MMYDKLLEAGIKSAMKLAAKAGLSTAQMSGARTRAAKLGQVALEEPAMFFYKQKLAPSQGVAILAGTTLIYQMKGQVPVPGAFPHRMEFAVPGLTFRAFKGRTLAFAGLKDTLGIELIDAQGTHLLAFASEEVVNRFMTEMTKLQT